MSSAQEPWANIRSVSTTSARTNDKIKRPRRAKGSRGAAAPHRLAKTQGLRAPITVTLQLRTGADAWLEVRTEEGRFFCAFDVSAFALVEQVIRGGHQVERLSGPLLAEHRRGVAYLSTPPSPQT